MTHSLASPESLVPESLRRTCLVDSPWYAGDIIAGRYRLEALIAEGGMGLVFRAHHLILDQPIALKLVRPSFARNPVVVARFLDEARALARLTSSHVVHVFDSGTAEDGTPYMALELLNGSDLHALLERDGPLSFELAAEYVLQACRAVAEAHSLGIVHRDLKPENLFLHRGPDGSPIIKLLDFGISKHLHRSDGRSHTVEGETVGSPHYMAPEQISARNVDERADIWALGVVLFELVTARLPFEGETFAQVYSALLGEEPATLSSFHAAVPPAFAAVVSRCLRKDPAHRYRSVTELAEALSAFVRGEAAPGPPDSYAASERPTVRSVAPRAEASRPSLELFARRRAWKSGWALLGLTAALATGTALASVLGIHVPLGPAKSGASSVNAAVVAAAAERPRSEHIEAGTLASAPAGAAEPPPAPAVEASASSQGRPAVVAKEVRRLGAIGAPTKPKQGLAARSTSTRNDVSKLPAPRIAGAPARAVDELIPPYEQPELRAQANDPKR